MSSFSLMHCESLSRTVNFSPLKKVFFVDRKIKSGSILGDTFLFEVGKVPV